MTDNDKFQRRGGKAPGSKFNGGKSGPRKGDGFKSSASGKPSRFSGKAEGEGGGRSDRSEKPFKSGFAKAAGGKPSGFKRDAQAAGKGADRDQVKAAFRPRRTDGAVSTGDEAMKPERISKLLARAGVASRRDVERMIMEGRVAVNGKVLDSPVLNATLADRIEVDGTPIRGIERTRLWLYHKPAGLVTTNSDPEGRPTVFDNLPEDLPRVMSIGRLDINTEGLLLLTNDGGLARVLELPTTGWLRRYRVRAYGSVDQAALDKLKDGIAVDGVLYGAIDATLDRAQGHNVWITMGLREGKNREIKNVLGALGLDVNRLIRISYGPFQLGDLSEGKAMEVRGRMLRDQLGPRLIEEAKANFDAPIFNAAEARDDEEEQCPMRPARSERAERPERQDEDRPARKGKPERKGSEGKGSERMSGRERALDRLDTSRRDERDFGKAKRTPAATTRTANVWMAPGARPVAAAKAEGEEREKPLRARGDGKRPDNRYGRNKDGSASRSLSRHDPDRKGGASRAFDPGPRVLVSRARDDEGEWIRAEEPARKADGQDAPRQRREGGFGGNRDGGKFENRRDGGKFEDRRGSGFGRDKPGEGRKGPPRSDAKPFGGKPGGKSFGGKPGGGKPFGGKPGGGRPSGKPGGFKGKR
ncbi:pseudouridine synthase [Allorhizobium undicola]|uniref:pseudouridine synthase n=1 Tax=Allorhizobium undicola TaxID=78527 RepID=UPI0009FC36D3|nr:pseudouridine synthase [Allorhizobium undicola]